MQYLDASGALVPFLVRFSVDFLSARPQTSIYWLVPLTHGTVTPVASIRREGEGLHTVYADCRGWCYIGTEYRGAGSL